MRASHHVAARWALALCLSLAGLGCGARDDVGSPSRSPASSPVATQRQTLVPLTGWVVRAEIAADPGDSALWGYAGGTGLGRHLVPATATTPATIRIGPLPSEFETRQLANLEPGAVVEDVIAWRDRTAADVPDRVRDAALAATGLLAGAGSIALEDVARLDVDDVGAVWRLRLVDPQVADERLLVWAPVAEDAPARVIDLRPWPSDDPYVAPYGVVLHLPAGGDLEVLDLISSGRGTGYFAELWERRRLDGAAATVVDARTAYEAITASPPGTSSQEVEITGARPFVEGEALRWRHYTATFVIDAQGRAMLTHARSQSEASASSTR